MEAEKVALYVGLGVTFLLVVALAIGMINLVSENKQLKSQVLELEAQKYQLSAELNRTKEGINRLLDELNSYIDRCVSCEDNLYELNHMAEVLREAFINYDKYISVLLWYDEVNNCADLLTNYQKAMEFLVDAEVFFDSHKRTLSRLFSDEYARQHGYKYGLDVDDLVNAIKTVEDKLMQDYKYCKGE